MTQTRKRAERTSRQVDIQDRAKVPNELKWDPSALFPSVAAWERERRALVAALPRLTTHAGHLGESPRRLKEALDAIQKVEIRLERLSSYASRELDVDVRQSRTQALVAVADKLYTDFLSATSYVEPELLALPPETLDAWRADPALADYDRTLADLLRQRDHVLSAKEEALLAGASALGSTPHAIYKTFANADLRMPTFEDHEGNQVTLSPAMYARYRQSHVRDERKAVFETYWSTFRSYRNSFAQMLSGQTTYYEFVARARGYPDSLTAALEPHAIPPSFYGTLVSAVTKHLGAFHRYLRLRKRLLGIQGPQHYYDIYPLPVEQGQRTYEYDEAKRIIRRALKPLGRGYLRKLDEALAPGAGWIDVAPNRGKRSGAYSASTYGEHPFVLLNYNDDFDSLSTMAHELGHALHSAYSNESQPYPKADYALFVAEVASIFNETLLIEHLLRREKRVSERRFLLAAYLDSFRGTVFRQTMFAEFELAVHQRVARRQALSADSLSRLYLRLLRKYHGHDKGVMHIAPLYGIEWAYIPHFYYNFYVYQYASGFVAATALAERVLTEGAPAARRYVDALLRAGSSMDPLDILRAAGVDMLTTQPYRLAIRRFSDRVRELAALSRAPASRAKK